MPVRDLLSAASGASAPADPYFYDVSLLLNGDGTNGAQNNTFLDSSSNNFTITRNGNTTQGSFSPYGNLWSNYFNGSSGLTIPYNSNWILNSNYTLEGWVFATGTGTSRAIIGTADSSGNSGWDVQWTSTNTISARWINSGSTIYTVASSALSANTWYHFAVTLNGTTLTLYINGTSVATTTVSGSALTTNYTLGIGEFGAYTSGQQFIGYISNIRYVKGSVVYTSNFTPSTTPLTAITNTQLLTCQSNRFIDNSSNAYAISVSSGTPSVQRFSPFNPTSPYSTATIGGSGYTDSSSDLSIAYNSALNFGSNDFTIEGWWYAASQPTNEAFWAQKGGSQYFILQPSVSGNNKIALYIDPLGAAPAIQGTTTLVTGTWYHVALVRKTNVFTLYLNGVQEGGTYTNSGNPTPSSGTTYINGQNYPVAAGWNGYVCDFRIVNGTAVYTSSFTPPTAPLTNITNTALLCNMTNAGIPDLAMQNDLQTVGSAQVSTSVVKYGTGSISFNGSTDYLIATANQNIVFNGDFTIECWAYPNSVSGNRRLLNSGYGGTTQYWILYNSGGTLQFFYTSSSGITSSTNLTANVWQHIAVVRSGTTLTMYVNGTSTASATVSGTIGNPAGQLSVGAQAGGDYFNGYLDDVRITNGYARYTANFTPPTSALPTY